MGASSCSQSRASLRKCLGDGNGTLDTLKMSAFEGLRLRWGLILGTPELACQVLSMAGSLLLSWAV